MPASQPGAIARLAAWTRAVRAEDFSQAALERAKLVLLDTIGCGVAALEDPCARGVAAALAALGETPRCTVLGRGRAMSAPSAVLANGTLCRVLDLNDYLVGANPQSGAGGGHPSDNIPVALAAAECAGASGRELLASILIGYEIYDRGKALMSAASAFDGVSISGLAAPAMAGRLLGLDAAALAHAIALGAARAPVPLAVREGNISAAKSIANALVAQSGMQAALLAAHGVTGPLDVLEAERGLAMVFSHRPQDAAALFGAPLPPGGLVGGRVAVKAYPCFAGAQCAVAAAIALHRMLDGDIARLAGEVEVVVAALPVVLRQISDPGRIVPRSREAADHSLQFLVAVALIDGTLGLRQFEAERWNDPAVRGLMARLRMIPDAALARRAGDTYPCALRARDGEGRAYDVECLAPPGFSAAGPQADVVVEKFSRMTAPVLPAELGERIVDTVMGLDSSPRCEGLFDALSPGARMAGGTPLA